MNRLLLQHGGTMQTRLIVLLSVLLLAHGCSTPGTGSTERATLHSGLLSNDGTFIVEWETDPAPIPVNEFFVIDARVLDAGNHGAPAMDVELSVDAAMPQHRHGMNHVPAIERLGPGHWRVQDMLFHMPGDWVIYFDISRDDVIRRAQVSIEVD